VFFGEWDIRNFPIPLGHWKYVGAYGIRPDDQTWGDKMGGNAFGGMGERAIHK